MGGGGGGGAASNGNNSCVSLVIAWERHCYSGPKGLLVSPHCWWKSNKAKLRCYGNKHRDKHSKHGCLLSSSSELLKDCRETAAGESSEWKAFNASFTEQLLNFSISLTHIWEFLRWLSLDRVSVSLLFMANWFVVRFWHKMAAMNHPGRPTGCWQMKCLHSRLTSALRVLGCPSLWGPPLWFQS